MCFEAFLLEKVDTHTLLVLVKSKANKRKLERIGNINEYLIVGQANNYVWINGFG